MRTAFAEAMDDVMRRLMEVRQEIADFVDALIGVYSICIIAWVVVSFVFSLGVRVPYNRFANAILDFLRDVSEPFLRIFRRLGLRIGPLDLSPIVALLTLQHRRAHHRQPDRPVNRGAALLRAAAVAAGVLALDQATKALVRGSIGRGERIDVHPRRRPDQHAQHRRRVRAVQRRRDDRGGRWPALALVALLAFFVTHLRRPLVWLPTGLLVGGAAGNLVDRAREGAVTDFVDLPLWPAFNVADAAITIGVFTLLYVLEGPPSRGAAAVAA